MHLFRSALRYSGSPRLLLGITIALVGLFAAPTSDARAASPVATGAAPAGACFFVLPNGSGMVNLSAVGAIYVNKAYEFGKVEVQFTGFSSHFGRLTLPEAEVSKLFEAVQAAAEKCRG